MRTRFDFGGAFWSQNNLWINRLDTQTGLISATYLILGCVSALSEATSAHLIIPAPVRARHYSCGTSFALVQF
jgi:hypothetical protein